MIEFLVDILGEKGIVNTDEWDRKPKRKLNQKTRINKNFWIIDFFHLYALALGSIDKRNTLCELRFIRHSNL